MAAESKTLSTRITASTDQENEILLEIFQNLYKTFQAIIEKIRTGYGEKDENTIEGVKKNIREKISHLIVKRANEVRLEQGKEPIPSTSFERIQNKVALFLIKMAFRQDFTGPSILPADQENEIVLEIFKNIGERNQNLIANLRIALVEQDKNSIEIVKNFIREELSYMMAIKANAERIVIRGEEPIPSASFERIQKAVTFSLIEMISRPDFTGQRIVDFYKNIARSFSEKVKAFQSVVEFMSIKREAVHLVIKSVMPDFWNEDRKKKFDIFWNKKILKFTNELRWKNKTFLREKFFEIFLCSCILLINVYVMPKSSIHLILIMVMGFVFVYTLTKSIKYFRIAEDATTLKYLEHIFEKEIEALSRFRPKIKKMGSSEINLKLNPSSKENPLPKIDLELDPLPSFEDIRKKVSANRPSWTDLNLQTQSTPLPKKPFSNPVVDLTRELGSSALYLGTDKEEKNTLFRFQASATPTDIRYVFVDPRVQKDPLLRKNPELWNKFINATRARLASKKNQQGIKKLAKKKLIDPTTGIAHSAYELKILGAEGVGNIRLLGTEIHITSGGKDHSVYVFNTVWDKKDMPRSFSYPLLAPVEAAPAASTSTSSSSSSSSSTTSRRTGRAPESRDRFVGASPLPVASASSASGTKTQTAKSSLAPASSKTR